MNEVLDVSLSAPQAGALSIMLGDWPRRHPSEEEAALALIATLGAARIFEQDRMPADVVQMGSDVTYAECANGTRRTVTVVYPAQAEAGAGRVSVLSPVGRALIGRRAGSDTEVRLPNGHAISLRIEVVTFPPRLET